MTRGCRAWSAALDQHHWKWIETTEDGRARRRSRLAEQVREALRESLIRKAAIPDLGPGLDNGPPREWDAHNFKPYTAIEQSGPRLPRTSLIPERADSGPAPESYPRTSSTVVTPAWTFCMPANRRLRAFSPAYIRSPIMLVTGEPFWP